MPKGPAKGGKKIPGSPSGTKSSSGSQQTSNSSSSSGPGANSSKFAGSRTSAPSDIIKAKALQRSGDPEPDPSIGSLTDPPFLLLTMFTIPFDHASHIAEFGTAVCDSRARQLESLEKVSLDLENMDAYLRARSRGVRRVLVYFVCQLDFWHQAQREDMHSCFRVLLSLMPDFEYGFQVVLPSGNLDGIPNARALARNAALGWFVSFGLSENNPGSTVMSAPGSAVVVRRDFDDSWAQDGENYDFTIVQFVSPLS